jgi:hypothetical protein
LITGHTNCDKSSMRLTGKHPLKNKFAPYIPFGD